MLTIKSNHFKNYKVSKPNKSHEQTRDHDKMLMIAVNYLEKHIYKTSFQRDNPSTIDTDCALLWDTDL